MSSFVKPGRRLRSVGQHHCWRIGRWVLGQVISALLGIGGTAAASGLDIGSIVSAFVTGGVGGGITTLVVAFLKAKLAR
jgi:hypothetical protein